MKDMDMLEELMPLSDSLESKVKEAEKPITILEIDIDEYVSSDIISSIAEIQQPRSDFQLQHFVINQHDTEEMKFVQCVMEIQQLRTTIKVSQLNMKRMQLEIAKLESSDSEIDAIEAEIKKIHLQDTIMISAGAVRELAYLLKIYNSFNKKYTRKDIEQAQITYWTKRLVRQAELDHIGNRGTVNPAHLEALRQIGQLESVLGINQELADSKEEKELE